MVCQKDMKTMKRRSAGLKIMAKSVTKCQWQIDQLLAQQNVVGTNHFYCAESGCQYHRGGYITVTQQYLNIYQKDVNHSYIPCKYGNVSRRGERGAIVLVILTNSALYTGTFSDITITCTRNVLIFFNMLFISDTRFGSVWRGKLFLYQLKGTRKFYNFTNKNYLFYSR